MKIFADTSGLYALLIKNDLMHPKAQYSFTYFSKQEVPLITTSFVVLETIALLQRRVGINAVYDFQSKLIPLLEIVWIDLELYNKGIQRLFALNNRNISLVDCISFEVMESLGITQAFTFDKHFRQMGFATNFN